MLACMYDLCFAYIAFPIQNNQVVSCITVCRFGIHVYCFSYFDDIALLMQNYSVQSLSCKNHVNKTNLHRAHSISSRLIFFSSLFPSPSCFSFLNTAKYFDSPTTTSQTNQAETVPHFRQTSF